MDALLGDVTVRFEYTRNVGPRNVHGAVALQFSRAPSFQFMSVVTWPGSDNFDYAVAEAVRDALAARGVLDQTSCKLISVEWDAVASCRSGFTAAARAATLAALEV